MRVRRGRAGRDSGAAAVEFALIMPVLFLLIAGMINYGFWFNDSLTLRQGVRDAARQAVVLTTYSGTDCPTLTGMDYVACRTKAQTITTGGAPAVKIISPGGWVRGAQVTICAMVKAPSFTGINVLPAGGFIKSKTTMSIENVTSPPSPLFHTDTGSDWSWCS